MKRTVVALTLLLSPVLVVVVFDLFVLPVDFFTFASWEALSVHSLHDYLPGPFYPNRHLRKTEQGDIGHHTIFAVPRETAWNTDAHGYRYADVDHADGPFDVVIVGTSFVVGAELPEPQMFDRQLAQATGLRIYPYAPRTLRDYINDPRFLKNPPAIVVWAPLEPYLPEAQPGGIGVRHDQRPSMFPQSWIILADRFTKAAWLEYLQTHTQNALVYLFEKIFLGKKYAVPSYLCLANDGSMVFNMKYISYPSVTDSDIAGFADSLKNSEGKLAQRGTRLLFCPIPRKSTVYYERVPLPRPTELLRLLEGVRARNVPLIDLLSVYWSTLPTSPELLYQSDDTHWNGRGVAIATKLVAQWIRATGFTRQ